MCTMVYVAVYFKLNRIALNSGGLIFFFVNTKITLMTVTQSSLPLLNMAQSSSVGKISRVPRQRQDNALR